MSTDDTGHATAVAVFAGMFSLAWLGDMSHLASTVMVATVTAAASGAAYKLGSHAATWVWGRIFGPPPSKGGK